MLSLKRTHCVAAVGIAMLGLASGRAEAGIVAYGYAQQQISGVSISAISTGSTLTVTTPVTTGTGDSASSNGSGISHNNTTDALQSYIGTPPPAPQNDFSKFATFAGGSPLAAGSLPIGLTSGNPLGDFTRGDVLISGLGTTSAAANSVAESYLNSVTNSQELSSSSYSATFSFTVSAATALNLAYHFENDLFAATSAGGQAQATYKFNVSIKDLAGNTVFNAATSATNLSSASPPNGVEIIRVGDEVLSTGTLSSGQVYTLTFSGTTTALVSAVPEPSTVVGAGCAILIGGLAALRRRKIG